MITDKRSQITTYIIIGMILLVLVILIIFIRYQLMNKQLNPEVDDVSIEFEDLQNYMLGCVQNTAQTAIFKLGEHAGHLDPTDPRVSIKQFNLNYNPTESDVLYIGSGVTVPYWWYMKSKNDCMNCQVSVENIPSIAELENQINDYVNTNLKECLNDFEDFKEKGYEVEERGTISTKTIIAKEDISVYVEYPIEVSILDKYQNMENFPVMIKLNFRDIYNLALGITASERNNQFLERFLMHLIAVYSGVDENKLPPTADSTSGSEIVRWSKKDVEKKLRAAIQSNVPLFQVRGTKNYQEYDTGTEFGNRLYQIYTLRNEKNHPSFEVNFIYLDWPIYLDITPSRGDILKPTSYRKDFLFNILPRIQTNNYEFFYDVGFPVLVEIRDTSAFSGTGYSFLFALEANVIDNKNLALWHIGQGTFGPWPHDLVTSELRDEQGNPLNLSVYDSESNITINLTFETPAKRLFCNENQRISGDITLIVKDSFTNKPVENAEIFYGCGLYSECMIAKTNRDGRFSGKLPVCIGGGYFKINKEGYSSFAQSKLTIKPEQKSIYRYEIKPMQEVKAHISLIEQEDLYGKSSLSLAEIRNLRGQAREMKRAEEAILTVSKVLEDPYEDNHVQMITIDRNTQDTLILKLTEGRYYVQGNAINLDGILIPQHYEIIAGENISVEEIEMIPAIIGGVELNEENGYFKISRNHFIHGDNVKFFMFAAELPQNTQEFDDLTRYGEFSTKFRSLVEPIFTG